MIEYDYDEVIDFCLSVAQRDNYIISDDLRNLIVELEECQDTFHCKGGSSANACLKIYQGFSTIIGSTDSGTGLAGIAKHVCDIFNTCYMEACTDKKILEEEGYSGSAASSTIASASVSAVSTQPNIEEDTEPIGMAFGDEQVQAKNTESQEVIENAESQETASDSNAETAANPEPTSVVEESNQTSVPESDASVESTPATDASSSWNGSVLDKRMGVNQGPSGKETYYNLDMSRVVQNMHDQGFEGEYWVRDDGVKMFGDYVIVSANLDVHPRGSIVESSLGTAIVCDTGGFASENPEQLDIATNW